MQDFQRWSRLLRQMQGENQARAGGRDMEDIETDDDGEKKLGFLLNDKWT